MLNTFCYLHPSAVILYASQDANDCVLELKETLRLKVGKEPKSSNAVIKGSHTDMSTIFFKPLVPNFACSGKTVLKLPEVNESEENESHKITSFGCSICNVTDYIYKTRYFQNIHFIPNNPTHKCPHLPARLFWQPKGQRWVCIRLPWRDPFTYTLTKWIKDTFSTTVYTL